MARMKKKAPKRRLGYEPAKGFPDPMAPAARTELNAITHMPHRNGTVCGRKERAASSYTVDRPTCEPCRRYYDSVNRVAKQA